MKGTLMEKYQCITLREKPDIKKSAAEWFSSKWNVPTEAYLECMDAYLQNETEYGWNLSLKENQIIGGMALLKTISTTEKTLHPMFALFIRMKNIVARELREDC